MLVASLWHVVALAQTVPPVTARLDVVAVDATVARTLKAFDVPGIAIVVVKDGQVVMAKGYGVRSLKAKAPMDTNTLFYSRCAGPRRQHQDEAGVGGYKLSAATSKTLT
ncbi:hypothetical protein A0257_08065 [Hymenobacter psoromatis]|nr:hypothetical protein A0257_08065 [Hymenobacter psoromatis]